MSLLRLLALVFTAMLLPPTKAWAQTEGDVYPVSFAINVGGQAGTLDLAIYLPLMSAVSETLPDGTKHHRFTSVNTEHEPFRTWQINKPGPTIPGYGPAEPYEVDTYLTPAGSSYLVFDWGYQVECHGWCSTTAHLRFDLASPDGSLFKNSLEDAVFALGSEVHGSGFERIVRTPNFGPGGPEIQLTRFTVGTVPEPESLALVMAGLMAIGLRRPAMRRTMKQKTL